MHFIYELSVENTTDFEYLTVLFGKDEKLKWKTTLESEDLKIYGIRGGTYQEMIDTFAKGELIIREVIFMPLSGSWNLNDFGAIFEQQDSDGAKVSIDLKKSSEMWWAMYKNTYMRMPIPPKSKISIRLLCQER